MATNNRGNIIPPRNDNKGNIVPHTISKQNTIFTGEGIIPEILGDNYLVSDDLVCTLPMTSGPNGTGIEDLVTARASDSGSYLDNITTYLDTAKGDSENLCLYSEDLTNAAWASSNVTKDSANTCTFTAQYSNIRQNIATVEGKSYAFSFKARWISGNTALKIAHTNSATGGTTNQTITSTLARYSVTVLGKVGDGNVTFGLQDSNATGHGQIEFTEMQVELLPSGMVYGPELHTDYNAASADTATFGAELIANGAFAADSDWTKGTGWTIPTPVASCDGTQIATSNLFQTNVSTVGNINIVVFTISGYSAGNIRATCGGSGPGTWVSGDGIHTEIITQAGDTTLYMQADVDFVGNIDNVSVKQITSTSGETNTTNGWTSVGLDGTGDNIFQSIEGVTTPTELITAQNDRDFSAGNIGNWTVSTDGAGTCAYNTTDVGGADDKQGLLTSSGDSYLFARLPSSDTTISADKWYEATARVYVPAGNTLKDVKFYSAGFDAEYATTITLSGDTQTTITLHCKIATDIVGYFRLGFSGNPTDGDLLYFDDISIKQIEAPAGDYVFYADANDTPTNNCRVYKDIATDFSLVVGKWYKITFDSRHIGSGDDWGVRLGNDFFAVGGGSVEAIILSNTDTTFATTTWTFQYTGTNDNFIVAREAVATNDGGIFLGNLSVKEIPNYTDLLPSTYTATAAASALIPAEIGITDEGLVKGPASGYVNLNVYCNYDDHTASNITPVQTATGPDGESNSAWTLTATAANGTIKHTPSGCATATDYSHTVWLKRVTGTGNVDLTIDDGGTWTTKTLTTSWQQFFVTKRAADPIIGIRIVDDTDSVAAWWPNITQSKYPLPNIYSNGSQVAQAPETVKSDISTNAKLRAALSDAVGGATSEGTMTVEVTPGADFADWSADRSFVGQTESNYGLLYGRSATNDFTTYDGTNEVNGPNNNPARGTKYYVAVRWSKSGNLLQIGAGTSPETLTWGTAGAYDGAFILGNDLHIGYNNEYPFEIKNLKFFDIFMTDDETVLAFY